MGKRILTLIGLVGVALLLIVGVAAAAGGVAPSDDVSQPASSAYGDAGTTTPIDTTTAVDETTVPGDEPNVTDGDYVDETDDDAVADGDTTESSEVHPDNFGGTISSLRHAGDHTPAAVIKKKHVPGWEKKHPGGTTTGSTDMAGQTGEG